MTSLVEQVAREMAGYSVGPSLATKYLDMAKTATAIVLEAAAEVAKAHKGSATKKRISRGQKLNNVTNEMRWEIVAEERGEDIAAEMIEAAIIALGDSHD